MVILTIVNGDQLASHRTVCRWTEQFKDGKINPKDQYRSGRPNVARTEQTVLLVKKVSEDDPHSTLREIRDAYCLSYSTVERILRQALKLKKKKVAARWIPHLLTETQKQQSVACSMQLLEMLRLHVRCHCWRCLGCMFDAIVGDV